MAQQIDREDLHSFRQIEGARVQNRLQTAVGQILFSKDMEELLDSAST